jgi:hypothetical protein
MLLTCKNLPSLRGLRPVIVQECGGSMDTTYIQVTLAGDKRLRRRNIHHALGTPAILLYVTTSALFALNSAMRYCNAIGNAA